MGRETTTYICEIEDSHREIAKKNIIKHLATISFIGFTGGYTIIMGVGSVSASRMAMEKANMKVNDIDYWKINEAFYIMALNCIKELGIDPDRVNVMGGLTAIGHPLGTMGIYLVGTLTRISPANFWHFSKTISASSRG